MRSASNQSLCPPGGEHFAALCRGMVVLVSLALPVGLTLARVAPPGPDGGNIAPTPASVRVTMPEDAVPRVGRASDLG